MNRSTFSDKAMQAVGAVALLSGVGLFLYAIAAQPTAVDWQKFLEEREQRKAQYMDSCEERHPTFECMERWEKIK